MDGLDEDNEAMLKEVISALSDIGFTDEVWDYHGVNS